MASQELSLYVINSQSSPPINTSQATSIPAITGNSLIGVFTAHAPTAVEPANEQKFEAKRIHLNDVCMRGMTLVALFRDIIVPFDKTAEREQLGSTLALLGALRQQCVEEAFNTTLAYQKFLNTALSKFDFIIEDLKAQDLEVLNHPSFPMDFVDLAAFKNHLKILSDENPEDPKLQQKVLFALSIVYQQKIAMAIRESKNPPSQALQNNYERLSVLAHELAPLNIPAIKLSDSAERVLSSTTETLTKQVKQAPIDNLKKVQFFDHLFPNQEGFKNVQKEVAFRLLHSDAIVAKQIPDKQEQSSKLYNIAAEFLTLQNPKGAEDISKIIPDKKVRAQVMVDVMRYFIGKGDKASAQGAIPKIAHLEMRRAAQRELS